MFFRLEHPEKPQPTVAFGQISVTDDGIVISSRLPQVIFLIVFNPSGKVSFIIELLVKSEVVTAYVKLPSLSFIDAGIVTSVPVIDTSIPVTLTVLSAILKYV